MPLLLPPAPRLSPAEREVYDHHLSGVLDAVEDPAAYFGPDAPPHYATSGSAQVQDLLDRLDMTAAAGLGDHRWQAAAERAARKCRAAWGAIT